MRLANRAKWVMPCSRTYREVLRQQRLGHGLAVLVRGKVERMRRSGASDDSAHAADWPAANKDETR